MSDGADFNQLLLVLGMATGTLMRGANQERLMAALATGTLDPQYITLLRDRLTAALQDGGAG